jgi:hypothetical protein
VGLLIIDFELFSGLSATTIEQKESHEANNQETTQYTKRNARFGSGARTIAAAAAAIFCCR